MIVYIGEPILLPSALRMGGMGGRPTEVADIEFLRAFAEHDHPVLTATEVGEIVGMSQPGAHQRLVELEEEGLVESAMKGPARVWWFTDHGRDYLESGLDTCETDYSTQ